MIHKPFIVLLLAAAQAWAMKRHAIVFTDGKTDDIMAHQILERDNQYHAIHFISEGVKNHQLVHDSIFTSRQFYHARKAVHHYVGSNVFSKAVSHEPVYDAAAYLLKKAPKVRTGIRDLPKHIAKHDRVDIFHHSPTPAAHVSYVLEKFAGQLDLYHLIHGYNSAQEDLVPGRGISEETWAFVETFKMRVLSHSPNALVIVTAGSSSFKKPSDGITVPMKPFMDLVPEFHIVTTMKDNFYARQMYNAMDAMGLSLPEEIKSFGGLQELVEEARKDDGSDRCTEARRLGNAFVDELIEAYGDQDTIILTRLQRSVRSAFNEPPKIEACDGMHLLHVLEARTNPVRFRNFRFYRAEKGDKIGIQPGSDEEGRNDGQSLFGLDGEYTSSRIEALLRGSVSPSAVSSGQYRKNLRLGESSSSNRLTRRSLYQKRKTQKQVAFALDIDGVLKHGNRVFPQAKAAIDRLVKDKIPFILLTNGGGYSEQKRAEALSKDLETTIDPDLLIFGRTPMRALAEKHKDDAVLVTGFDGGQRHILEKYGFNNVYTAAEIQHWNTHIFPFSQLRAEQCSKIHKINDQDIEFKAFFFLQESDDWGRDIQYALDIMSPPYGPMVGGKAKSQRNLKGSAEIPTLYYASADLLTIWSGITSPRLAMGALKLSLESIYDRLVTPRTGVHLKDLTVTYGKPSKLTYDYAVNTFRDKLGVTQATHDIWMIGDNPDVDIKGAKDAGWNSALVKSGVFQDGETPSHEPDMMVEDVMEAVECILSECPQWVKSKTSS